MKDLLEQFKRGRHEFENGSLEKIEGYDPFVLFEEWMTEAVATKEHEPNAFVLSTAGKDLQPSSRIVYLKDVVDHAFVFYTNYLSQKGMEIEENSKISMLFFWPVLSRQIRVEGKCSKVDPELSDDYFASRPRASQIGAWASLQSQELRDRADLEKQIELYDQQFKEEVPRPPHWGGYKIEPSAFEFWQGRPSRLHDRVRFESNDHGWIVSRLNP